MEALPDYEQGVPFKVSTHSVVENVENLLFPQNRAADKRFSTSVEKLLCFLVRCGSLFRTF